MKKKVLNRFILANFIISVVLNTAVVSPHIITATEPHLLVPDGFSFTGSLYIIALSAGLSIAIFAITSVVLYVSTMALSGMRRTRSFWFLVLIGMVASVVADKFINVPLAKYNDQTNWISMIAAFSVLVGLSSQYQLYIGELDHVDYSIEQ